MTNFDLSASTWQYLYDIDDLLSQPLSWTERLEKVNDILINMLDVDIVWLSTVKPLFPAACGLVRTPLPMATNAQVSIIDKYPLGKNNPPDFNDYLKQLLSTKKPFFIESDSLTNKQIVSDLGDLFFSTFHTVAFAVVPITANDEILGAFVIGGYKQTELSQYKDMQRLLAHLGKHLGIVLKNACLAEHHNHYDNLLRTLNLIAQTITSSLDIEEIISRTMDGINEILNVEAGSLLMIDEKCSGLCFKVTLRGENKEITSYRLQLDEDIAGWAVQNNQPIISNNPKNDNRFSQIIDRAIGFSIRNILCVPLVVQGKPIGALETINKRSGLFNDSDQKLLISMAASLGIALQNAILYEDIQTRAKRTETINQLIIAVNIGYGLSETGQIIFEQFSKLFSFDHINISFVDHSKKYVDQWVFNEYGCFRDEKAVIPLQKSSLLSTMKNAKGYICDNIDRLSYKPDNQILIDNHIKSIMVVPLVITKKPYGTLCIGSQQPNAYGVADLRLLEQIMPDIVIAIDKSRKIDVMERRNTELQRLNHLSEMLVSTTDTNIIVDTVLSMLPRLVPGNVQGIVVAGERGLYMGVALPFDFERVGRTVQDILEAFFDISDTNLSTELIYSKHIGGNMPVSVDWKPVTVVTLPLLTQLGVAGIIYGASDKKEFMSSEALHTFSLVASQISASVENAHLFRQIEKEKARLSAILTSSTDAVLVVDNNGRVVLDNPATWQIMGVTETQYNKILAECSNNETLINLFEATVQGKNQPGEIPIADGRTFFANLSPISTPDSEVIGWVAIMQDVSHFKELNQLKTDFVHSVSHDLRSPLAGILLATHMVTEVGQINEIQVKLINTIKSRAKAMNNLIDNLLDVGKIEAGIDMEMELSSIIPIIDEAYEFLEPQARDKFVGLYKTVEADLPMIMVNPLRMRQVIHNLVGNAIKYTPEGGKISINAFCVGDEIMVQVIDTGFGVPVIDQPHIFEKFYRVKDYNVAKIKGTGLGLAITKTIVEKLGGRIWLESVFGEGSVFTITFPLKEFSQISDVESG